MYHKAVHITCQNTSYVKTWLKIVKLPSWSIFLLGETDSEEIPDFYVTKYTQMCSQEPMAKVWITNQGQFTQKSRKTKAHIQLRIFCHSVCYVKPVVLYRYEIWFLIVKAQFMLQVPSEKLPSYKGRNKMMEKTVYWGISYFEFFTTCYKGDQI
jgi:hypothetical protein